MTIDAFGFDFDHTLGRDNALERHAFFAYARELGTTLDEHDEAILHEIDRALDRVRSGSSTLEHEIPAFYGAHGMPGARADSWKRQCFALVPSHVKPSPGAVELLAKLRVLAIPTAILTNGWTPLQQMKIAQALGEDAVTTILVSDQLGVLKPARAAFDALAEVLPFPRARIAYVGDNPAVDVGGALAAGMQAVWVDVDGLTYPPDVPPPTLRVTALGELEELIENTQVP